MKKNDIIDKLNIIDRKIDELTYLNVSAIVDEDADKKDDVAFFLAILALICRLTRVSAKHVSHWCKPSMCLQHLRKMPEIPTKQPFPATFVNFISILSQKEKTSHIDPFK